MACSMASSSRTQIKDSNGASFCGPVQPYSMSRSIFSPSPRTSPFLPSSSSPCRSPVSSSSSERFSKARKNCMCCPSSHPGACRYSKNRGLQHQKTTSLPNTSSSANFRKLAIKNSLIKMGGMAAEVAKKTLIILRPSPVDQPRLAVFKHRPSRLSVMSQAKECS